MLHINFLLLFIIFAMVLFAIMLLIFFIYRNKFIFLNVKINEADKELDSLFCEKKRLLFEIYDTVVETLDKDVLGSTKKFDDITDRFVLSSKLYDMEKGFLSVLNYKKAFIADDNLSKLVENLNTVSGDCLSTEGYYNDKASELNKLLENFPSRIVGKLTGNIKKNKFEHKEEEVFEILKDK